MTLEQLADLIDRFLVRGSRYMVCSSANYFPVPAADEPLDLSVPSGSSHDACVARYHMLHIGESIAEMFESIGRDASELLTFLYCIDAGGGYGAAGPRWGNLRVQLQRSAMQLRASGESRSVFPSWGGRTARLRAAQRAVCQRMPSDRGAALVDRMARTRAASEVLQLRVRRFLSPLGRPLAETGGSSVADVPRSIEDAFAAIAAEVDALEPILGDVCNLYGFSPWAHLDLSVPKLRRELERQRRHLRADLLGNLSVGEIHWILLDIEESLLPLFLDGYGEASPPRKVNERLSPIRGHNSTSAGTATKTVKRPRDFEFRAWWLLRIGKEKGLTQAHVAALLSQETGGRFRQSDISRSCRHVEEYRNAGGVIPTPEELGAAAKRARKTTVDPSRIDLGKREDRHAKRQQPPREDEDFMQP